MPMYSKWIYPKIEIGQSHVRPIMPTCFVKLHECSVTWNIFSNNDNDRAEYWEVDLVEHTKVANIMPALMTATEVELEVYGSEGKSAWMTAHQGSI